MQSWQGPQLRAGRAEEGAVQLAGGFADEHAKDEQGSSKKQTLESSNNKGLKMYTTF